MPNESYKHKRIFVDHPLKLGVRIQCSSNQAHYLVHVLRLKIGDRILVFNGLDGEWCACLTTIAKAGVSIEIVEHVRSQSNVRDIDYVFAPLKHTRLDYMVQKVTEMGVRRLCPIYTQFTIVERINLQRMRANIIEAVEQCGLLSLPVIDEPKTFRELIHNWDQQRNLIFCDEAACVSNPIKDLKNLKGNQFAVLVGPEGGFSKDERDLLLQQTFTHPISLGPRILRADTAAVSALSLVNATLGDWC